MPKRATPVSTALRSVHLPLRLAFLAAFSLLVGCASFERAPIEDPLTAAEADLQEEELFRKCSALPSPDARELMEQLAAQNLELRAAWARVRVVRAQARQRAAELLPSLQLSGQANRSKTNPPQIGPIAARGAFIIEQYEASVAAEYELDLWNRLGNTAEAAALQAAAQRMDARTMAVSLSAQLLESWYGLSFQLMQRELIEDQLQTNRQLLELLKQRFVQGAGPVLDALQQKQQLAALESTLAENRADIDLQQQQLAVLLGRDPGEPLGTMPGALPELAPLDQQQTISAAALALRPDLRSSFYLVQAADARLAAALAQRLPAVRLSTAVFNQGEDLAGVVDGLLWRIAGSLLLPLYDGGRIAARIEEAEATHDLQILQYRQQLLTALQELSAAWVAERREATRLQDLIEQQAIAEKSYRLARQQYLRGAVDYLRVLNALQSMVDIEQRRLLAQRQRIASRIQLCRALGAGWLADTALSPVRSNE